ncbi:Na(+)/H(+) antiporter subunit E [Insulibacter thermoxylanivorax]|uniref:Na(+)/H(+) antiporter subunit E n=1 Tax=Insulibacter thermoxylanivorax TaxID=2749268 RepID=A0A916QGU6_9BACL|nr:Na+/H+ antiporter subunit E [Insulibacter thermoxylanivorax]GFR38634.1 Na(+)/H(+) antiporter subunit E [Insulibacter thermoxylanivorax]
MARQIVLNFLLAFVWMFLNSDWTLAGLFIGYVVGILPLVVFRRFFDQPLYLRKVWACIRLFYVFMKLMIISNIDVLRHLFRRKLAIRPGIVALKTTMKTDLEITLFTNMITLTPGTVAIEVSLDKSTVYIHAMDIDDAEKLATDLKNSLERAIMGVTR